MDETRELLRVATAAFAGGALRALPLMPDGPCKAAVTALSVAAESWLSREGDEVARAQALASSVPVPEDHELSGDEEEEPVGELVAEGKLTLVEICARLRAL